MLIENKNQVLKIIFSEKFNIYSVSEARKNLLINFKSIKAGQKLILNLEKVKKIDTSGLQLLLSSKKYLDKEKIDYEFIFSTTVQKILQLYKLEI